MKKIHIFLNDQKGATAIEYALIATGVSLAIAVSVFAFGDEVAVLYDGLAGSLTNE